MKIGSAITFLLLALVALGYLLSDNINTREELFHIRQQIQELSQENLALRAERDAAIEGFVVSEQKVEELTRQNLVQQEQISRLNEENQYLKEQNAVLQGQSEVLKFVNSFRSAFPRSLSPALLLPIIPISMAASYVVVRYNRKHSRQGSIDKKSRRKTLVQLTDDEVKEIIRLRRKK
jgi:hypothetical protein